MNVLWVLVGMIGLEVSSIFIHRYLFHGPLWKIHKTHHLPSGAVEWNDVFSIVFAALGIIPMVWHAHLFEGAFYFGLGISVYGLVYFLLHDVAVHRRLKWPNLRFSPRSWAGRVVSRHRVHHQDVSKKGQGPFGLLGPW